MAVRKLRLNQDEILRKPCKSVKQVDEKIREILKDMMDTLHSTENGTALNC